MTQTIVLATDGSAYSDAAARCIAGRKLLIQDITVHVLHCTPELSGEVRSFLGQSDIAAWHQEESAKAMASVVAILGNAGIPFETHALVGFAPERIVQYSQSVQAGAIVMGSHGRGAFVDAVLGSVANRVVARAECPVIFVKVPKPVEDGRQAP
ncbi:universal stress protein [Ralstonia solanacearum]|uniref:universal stress protein n=1 Tax=Ralstonia pseudosolanacearum TaxID=1310165 RepID=UPI000C9FCC62|nr:universal stress protein [Ralstonia pseudosolanacearum]AUS41611.1 universal stress protein [Ralstonia solanacearum]